MTFATVSIHGVPRSGTSWLGQIFNSHPEVAYRHQPLFSHRFKNRLDKHFSAVQLSQFLDELYACNDDDFINDQWEESRVLPFEFSKSEAPATMVMKMVRFHHLVARMLELNPELRVIGIVRHPCAVINSWLQAPREFDPSWDPMEEWQCAPRKNRGRAEEFNGFHKWQEVAQIFLDLDTRHERFMLVRYEDLVDDPLVTSRALLAFCGLGEQDQVSRFIAASQQEHDAGEYALTKDASVKDRWRV